MEQTRSELKDKFQDGDIPTGTDFANLIDSFLNFEDDGMTSFKSDVVGSEYKRFGIGDTAPECPLGITGEADGDDGMICFTSKDGSTKWNINLNPSSFDIPGFSIDDISTGTGISRFFIQPETGYVGIGTMQPEEILHVEGNVPVGYVSELFKNVGTMTDHQGFLISHYAGDSSTDPRDGAFAILENAPGGKVERITALPEFVSAGQKLHNVGINETMPFCTLHVSRALTDPKRFLNLAENTGILLLGSIEDKNLVFDASDIQGRITEVLGDGTLSITASALGLQPKGGEVIVHSGLTADKRINITESGFIGVGKTAVEKVDVNGAITIADAVSPSTSAAGTIRWTGTDFEGRKGTSWVSLTHGSFTDGIWQQPGGAESNLIYFDQEFDGVHTKVGIGLTTPTKTLHVFNDETAAGTNNSTMLIRTEATVTGTAFSNTRIGLEIQGDVPWSTNPDARNVGIYVSNIQGQDTHEANIAAMFNGNTVIGTLTSESVVGVGGTNVLAIQTGEVPTTGPGTTDTGGIQIYSNDISVLSGGPPVSVVHFMNGDGTEMRLFNNGSITANNVNTPNTGNPITDAIISNTRQRVLDLENVLRNLGLLV
jgi:hypothetical protein